MGWEMGMGGLTMDFLGGESRGGVGGVRKGYVWGVGMVWTLSALYSVLSDWGVLHAQRPLLSVYDGARSSV